MTAPDPLAPATVGRTAFLIGFAGLLPQIGAVALILLARAGSTDLAGILALAGYALALIYGGLILSFLGGIWWGFAMRRSDGQGGLAAAAVAPSLAALTCIAVGAGNLPGLPSPWSAVALGSVIMATLLVDRHLVGTGEAPANWMRLRAPLSLGLGGLTIVAGVLVGTV